MQTFLEIAFSFPTAFYSVVLCSVVLYWLLVIVGALDFDMFTGGLDSIGEGAEGLLEGVGEGVAEGAAEAAGEAIGEAAGDAAGDAILESSLAGSTEGTLLSLGGLLTALGIRQVPVTITLTLMSLFSWMGTYYAWWSIRPLALEGVAKTATGLGVMLLAFIASIIVTAVMAQPLKGLFKPEIHHDELTLTGQLITVKSTRVNEKFGQGEFDDGGAGLLLNIFCATDNQLKKGQQAVLLAFDSHRNSYEVAPYLEGDHPQAASESIDRSLEVSHPLNLEKLDG